MRIVVLEKTLESLLDCKEIKPVNPKGGQSWIFIGRTGAEAEAPALWPPDGKNWLTGKDPDTGKDWRREEKGTRGWDDWMASPTRWTWIWASSGSWWWTGKPGMLQSMALQSQTQLRPNWTEITIYIEYLAWQQAGHVVRVSQTATIAMNLILQLLKMDGNIAWSPQMDATLSWLVRPPGQDLWEGLSNQEQSSSALKNESSKVPFPKPSPSAEVKPRGLIFSQQGHLRSSIAL